LVHYRGADAVDQRALISARNRRALAICVIFGLLGWIAFSDSWTSRFPPEQRTVEGSAENPAPQGAPQSIATAAMKDADRPCGAVLDAIRLSDGSIRAVCSNGEAYQVFSLLPAPAPR